MDQDAENPQNILAHHRERSEALQAAYERLKGRGLLSRATLHLYKCSKGCVLVTVFVAEGRVLAHVRDHKMAPRAADEQAHPVARARLTLDGDRHWPAAVHDVAHLCQWGRAVAIPVACRHFWGELDPSDVLRAVGSARPGKTGQTRLSPPGVG